MSSATLLAAGGILQKGPSSWRPYFRVCILQRHARDGLSQRVRSFDGRGTAAEEADYGANSFVEELSSSTRAVKCTLKCNPPVTCSAMWVCVRVFDAESHRNTVS